MNMHVPMTLESVVELRFLASIPTQIVSPQASKPVMGLVQDSLLGTYLLTQCKSLTHHDMTKLICSVSSFSEDLPLPEKNKDGQDPRWSSQQMLSMFLPEITYKKGARKESEKEKEMRLKAPKTDVSVEEQNGAIDIVAGKMSKGVLDSNSVGKKNNSLFHIAWNDHGPSGARDLFNGIAFSANTWLQIHGFSVGISDCVIPQSAKDIINKHVIEAKQIASDAIQSAKLGKVTGTDPFTYKREFPKKIIETMGKCRKAVEEETAKNIDAYNAIDIMVKCGSKGNKNNLSQIVGMLGQQEIEQSWIEDQLNRRTLPFFHKDDLRPEAHGFIGNSFMSGLSPTEYWFHAQEGRIGIITKAIKTAETGYIQRKLIKAMEDLRVCYDGTVRNANNIIIQTVYGNDGFDACYIETQTLPFLNYNMSKLCQAFKHTESEGLKAALTPQAYKEFMDIATRDEIMEGEFTQITKYYDYLKNNVPSGYLQPDVRSPINFKRIISNIITKFGLDKAVIADINPAYIVEKVRELRNKLIIDPNETVNCVSTIIINSLMATYLSSKALIYEHKFNKMAFDYLMETVYMTFLKALINPGENVGIIAAQSLGEPTTQMALNTFHYTGQGSKANISRGTPRLKELMSVSRNAKTPSLTIHLLDNYFLQEITDATTTKTNTERATKFANEIEHTFLRDVLIRSEIFYDENDHSSCVREDQEFVDTYYDLLPTIDEDNEISDFKWLLRLEFDREAIMRKHIPMYLIEHKLNEYLKGIGHSVIVSDENAHKLICRIKVKSTSDEGDDDPINYLRCVETQLLDVEIKGVSGIQQCWVNPVKKNVVLPDGRILSPFDSNPLEYEEAIKKYNNLKYLIETNGKNLMDILCLPNVDTYNTVSNDVWEIYQLYGVEAARKCIITEINQLLEYNETYIQDRHVSLLVDVMTNQGILVSVDRHGVNKTESGPLHRASFEETTTQLTNASIFNEVDMMTGVSGNIMFGQFIPTGTNAFRISLDMEKIKRQTPAKQDIVAPIMRKQQVVSEVLDLTDLCADENFDFSFKLNTIQGKM
jgi:DNA-directed RNA polymerase II subunit RPB1